MNKILVSLLLLLGAAPAQAKRVVSLMPSYTEIIFELGAGKDLVGVSNFCNWPAEALKIEKAGDYLRPNIEKVYSLKPDVVFTGAWAGASVAKQLSSLGVKVVALPEEKKVEDVYTTIKLIAAELGRKAEGAALAARLAKRLKAVARGPEFPLNVYIEADGGGWTTGSQSFLSDAVTRAGGVNVFGKEKRGYFQATWEEVLLLDPEAVILLFGTTEEFAARPMAGGLAAVRAGRVITTLNRDAFTRPGPRLFNEIARLREILYERK